MKNVFVNFTFAKLWNSEIPELTEAILETVEKYNPESMKIAGMYNLLSAQKPLLDILAVKYSGYPNATDFKAQYKLRNNLLVALNSHINAIEKGRVASLIQQAQVAVPYLNGYLKGISKEPDSVKSGRVNQMLNGLTGNDEVTTALSVLEITPFMDELKGYQQQINRGESQRRESLAVRPKFNNKDARERVITAVRNLLNAIELAKVEHTELDYMPLINELNVVLTTRQTVIKSRTTRNSNAANKSKASEPTGNEDTTPPDDNKTTDASSTKTDASAI